MTVAYYYVGVLVLKKFLRVTFGCNKFDFTVDTFIIVLSVGFFETCHVETASIKNSMETTCF